MKKKSAKYDSLITAFYFEWWCSKHVNKSIPIEKLKFTPSESKEYKETMNIIRDASTCKRKGCKNIPTDAVLKVDKRLYNKLLKEVKVSE